MLLLLLLLFRMKKPCKYLFHVFIVVQMLISRGCGKRGDFAAEGKRKEKKRKA